MLIKVCGIAEKENMAAIAALGPDMMGFVFYPFSKRYMAEKLGSHELNGLPAGIMRVGVFVNETTESILEIAHNYGLHFLQLHGNESPEQCKALQEKGYKVIKAFGIDSQIPYTVTYESCCDMFLFDTKTGMYGGSGKRYDWSILSKYSGSTPFLLSGGISLEMAGEIKEFSHPKLAGLDINSRFETEPGIKDTGMVKEFLTQIRSHVPG